ncbi:MAG TPA: BON domain-containing protein [Alphaproteobacteria bacterium]|nr:BON domain-containing protein [Alphaproteobacteria bacterium]
MRANLRLLLIAMVALGAAPSVYGENAAQARPRPRVSQRMQENLIREVRHELVMLPQLSIFDNLAYKVQGDSVTLLGQVHNATLKDDAERVVKKIEGVERVDNRIEILPASFNDDRIRRETARAIFNDSRLFPYAIQSLPPIRIIVKNGHVSLEGTVRNQGDKDTAGIIANGVPGVFSVKNNLQVERAEIGKK